KEPYWTHISRWKDISPELFKDHQWQLFNSVSRQNKLESFLDEVIPNDLTPSNNDSPIKTKWDFIQDASDGLKNAPMNIRITPHLLSLINWSDPLDDPIRRQFLPSAIGTLRDHPKLTLDSLHEEADSPISGLVHRYPGRALFLVTSICPVYCRFCTRSYAVGGDTSTVEKRPQKPSRKRWEEILSYIATREDLHDIVVSGGDCFYLPPEALKFIGERLLEIPHIRRFRIASKGLAVSPGRIQPTDAWTNELIALSNRGRQEGKQVCLHTHFNHPREITWITEESARHLFANGVIVRNQSVLLRGINDDTEVMAELINRLSELNIQPYYVYQCDLVRGIEDLRTPLSTILRLEKEIRGRISGFMMPSFVVDLPGGGGKRLASTHDHYDKETGISKWSTPGLPGEKGKKIYFYHDPQP
ncbi:kama family protein, partial [Periconia macrospinosa]